MQKPFLRNNYYLFYLPKQSCTFARMDVVFTEKEQNLFSKIGKVADELGTPCYLIGGYVRDIILNRIVKD
ncbi:hypothetical protein, partial [Escherichia coli]|uniref:hypothetical protein n=1 Tax=Escherichia coli TaxID=562 RepID=UPI001953D481